MKFRSKPVHRLAFAIGAAVTLSGFEMKEQSPAAAASTPIGAAQPAPVALRSDVVPGEVLVASTNTQVVHVPQHDPVAAYAPAPAVAARAATTTIATTATETGHSTGAASTGDNPVRPVDEPDAFLGRLVTQYLDSFN